MERKGKIAKVTQDGVSGKLISTRMNFKEGNVDVGKKSIPGSGKKAL